VYVTPTVPAGAFVVVIFFRFLSDIATPSAKAGRSAGM
jgi:hypothetical protein